MRIFKIRNVGRNHGDCFFLEIGNAICRNIIMVDGRRGDKESLEEISDAVLEYKQIDYLIITHVDEDHLLGIKKLFDRKKEDPVRKAFANTVILYNYVSRPVISYQQAKEFEKLILEHTVISTVMKNYTFYSSPCLKIISSEMRRELDPREQGEYAVLTLLHPKREGVEKLYKDYLKWERNQGKPDNLLINQQSIVFLLEYGENCVLFTGDCNMDQVMEEIDQLKHMRQGKEYRKIDLIKLAHHGANENNKGLPQFAANHKCNRYYVTGKEVWDGKHPSQKLLQDLTQKVGEKIYVYTQVNINSENGYQVLHQDELILQEG